MCARDLNYSLMVLTYLRTLDYKCNVHCLFPVASFDRLMYNSRVCVIQLVTVCIWAQCFHVFTCMCFTKVSLLLLFFLKLFGSVLHRNALFKISVLHIYFPSLSCLLFILKCVITLPHKFEENLNQLIPNTVSGRSLG